MDCWRLDDGRLSLSQKGFDLSWTREGQLSVQAFRLPLFGSDLLIHGTIEVTQRKHSFTTITYTDIHASDVFINIQAEDSTEMLDIFPYGFTVNSWLWLRHW